MFSLSFAHLSEISKPNSAKRLTTSSYPSTFLSPSITLLLPSSSITSLILTGEISANILTDLLGELDDTTDGTITGTIGGTIGGVLGVCGLDCDVTRVRVPECSNSTGVLDLI